MRTEKQDCEKSEYSKMWILFSALIFHHKQPLLNRAHVQTLALGIRG